MANALNLGRVTDFIKSFKRVKGDGSPGTVDTYRLITESGLTQDVDVYQGADGSIADLVIEDRLSPTSTNLVTNRAVTKELIGHSERIDENNTLIRELQAKLRSQTTKLNEYAELLNYEMDYQQIPNTFKDLSRATIPLAIGDRSVIGNGARMLLTRIEGKTEASKNILPESAFTSAFAITNHAFTTTGTNGTKVLSISLANGRYYAYLKLTKKPTTSTTFTIYNSGNLDNPDVGFTNFQSYDLDKLYKVTIDITNNALTIYLWGNENSQEVSGYLWLSKSADMDDFAPYYEGLKSVENLKLSVYGKASAPSSLKVGDEVTCLYFKKLTGTEKSYTIVLDNNIALYISPAWGKNNYQYDAAGEVAYSTNGGNETGGHYMFEGGGYLFLNRKRKVTSIDDPNSYVMNATMVSPISGLPIGLALRLFEKIDVEQTADDLFNIKKTSNYVLKNVYDVFVGHSYYRDTENGGKYGADDLLQDCSEVGSSSLHDMPVITRDQAYGGTRGISFGWICIPGLTSGEEYVAWLTQHKDDFFIVCKSKTSTESVAKSDLSLGSVSAPQGPAYLVMADNTNSDYGVRPDVTFDIVTKGVKANG